MKLSVLDDAIEDKESLEMKTAVEDNLQDRWFQVRTFVACFLLH